MIVPCIDLMGGRAVQLVQGRDLALERSVETALALFEGFPLIHVIDLDAAMGQGDNSNEVSHCFERRLARIGGGIRTVERAEALVESGANQVIIGSAAYKNGKLDTTFLNSLERQVGREKVIVAVDVIGGKIAVDGWKTMLDARPIDVLAELEEYCSGVLCTNVDYEGKLSGTDLEFFLGLRLRTSGTLIAAGGITHYDEIEVLTRAGIEVALGMAVYTGRLDLARLLDMSQTGQREDGAD